MEILKNIARRIANTPLHPAWMRRRLKYWQVMLLLLLEAWVATALAVVVFEPWIVLYAVAAWAVFVVEVVVIAVKVEGLQGGEPEREP